MKPWETLAHATTPDGGAMRLSRRDGEYVIWVDGRSLMSSRAHGSEESLAEAGCGHLRGAAAPRVLVGGLGMGFTLRAALDVLPADARVVVAELVPEVVAWNRDPLGALAGHPLRDPRVRVAVEDVGFTLRAHPGPLRRHPARRGQRPSRIHLPPQQLSLRRGRGWPPRTPRWRQRRRAGGVVGLGR